MSVVMVKKKRKIQFLSSVDDRLIAAARGVLGNVIPAVEKVTSYAIISQASWQPLAVKLVPPLQSQDPVLTLMNVL